MIETSPLKFHLGQLSLEKSADHGHDWLFGKPNEVFELHSGFCCKTFMRRKAPQTVSFACFDARLAGSLMNPGWQYCRTVTLVSHHITLLLSNRVADQVTGSIQNGLQHRASSPKSHYSGSRKITSQASLTRSLIIDLTTLLQ